MKISIFILPPFLAGLYTLILGLFVLLKNKSSVLNRSFFLLCLSVLVWQFGNVFVRSSGTSDLAIFWARIVYFGVAFIPAAFYHFSVEFNKLRKQKIWVLFMYLLCCLLLFLVMRNNFIISSYETAWGRRTLAGRSHAIFLTFWFLPLILALFNFYYGYRKAISPFERQRRRFLLVSSFISCFSFSSSDWDIIGIFLPLPFRILMLPGCFAFPVLYISCSAGFPDGVDSPEQVCFDRSNFQTHNFGYGCQRHLFNKTKHEHCFLAFGKLLYRGPDSIYRFFIYQDLLG